MRTLKGTDNLVAVTLNRVEREFVLNAIDDMLFTVAEASESGVKAKVALYDASLRMAKDLNFRLGGNADAWWMPVKKSPSKPTKKSPARRK